MPRARSAYRSQPGLVTGAVDRILVSVGENTHSFRFSHICYRVQSSSYRIRSVEPVSTISAIAHKNETDYKEQYTTGVKIFARLFTRWMDTNEWSHPVMTHLTKCAMHGTAWLHSSQISGLRHGKLISPGLRTFIAIAVLNDSVFRYQTKKLLIPNTTSSNHYERAIAITEDGLPPDAGWWFKVFCGICVPKDVDVTSTYYTEEQSETFSRNWARYFRKIVSQQGFDLIEDLPKIIREYYPAGDNDRVNQLIAVIHAESVWNSDELINELPALSALTGALGGPSDETQLLSEIG